jgi:hypothetical protein
MRKRVMMWSVIGKRVMVGDVVVLAACCCERIQMMIVNESVTTTGMRRDIKKNKKIEENVTANTRMSRYTFQRTY